MSRVFLSLGSNLGDRLAYLRAVVAALDRGPRIRVMGTSKVYETAPVEVEEEQPVLGRIDQLRDLLGEEPRIDGVGDRA